MSISRIVTQALALSLFTSTLVAAQQAAPVPDGTQGPEIKSPAKQIPPDTHAPAKTGSAASSAATQSAPLDSAKGPDRAASYYHYSLAHIYEELASLYGRTEYAAKAVSEFKAAIAADPSSEFLNAGLAELYAKTGQIRAAVTEAQDVLKRDPNNPDAHKLLGRIYLRSLGDMQAGTQSQEMLRLAIEQYEAISKIEPNAAENYLLLGRLYMLNKDLAKAENAFKQAAKLDPGSEEAVTNLAYLYNEEGDGARAAQVLNSVPEASRTGKLYAALGYTYEQQHDSKKAVDAYRKAVNEDKDNLDAVRGLAQNLLNDGQTEAALEQYKAVVEADPQDAQAYLRIAEIDRRLGRYDDALASLTKAESMVQDSLEVPFNKALVYEAEGRFDDAVSTIDKLLDRTAKPDGTYTQQEANNRMVFLDRLAAIYREQNKTQPAIDIYQKMLAFGGDNALHGYQEMVDTYRDAKEFNLATQAAKDGLAKFPNDPQLKLSLASQIADEGKPDEAIAMARSLLKGKPEDRDVYIGLSQIDMRLKRFKDAEDAISQASKLSLKPEDKREVDYIWASIYEREKKDEAAEDLFRRILREDPDNAAALNYLGYMLADRGVHLDEALTLTKKAVSIEPQNFSYLDSLGWAYFKLGNYDMAEANLRKAIDKSNSDPTINDHLGDLYQKMGRLKLAAAHWERALAEWQRSAPGDVDSSDVSKTQKKLETARVKLANKQQ